MNDIRSNIQPHVPIHLSTAVIIDGHSNIHSYVSIYLHVISRVSLNLYISIYFFCEENCEEIAYHCVHIFPPILAQKYIMFVSSIATPYVRRISIYSRSILF